MASVCCRGMVSASQCRMEQEGGNKKPNDNQMNGLGHQYRGNKMMEKKKK